MVRIARRLQCRLDGTYLSSPVLCGAFRGGEFSPALGAALARVPVVDCTLAHLVRLTCDCWINCMGRTWWRGVLVLGQWLVAGLARSSSEEMFS